MRPFRAVLGTVFVVALDALSDQPVEKIGHFTLEKIEKHLSLHKQNCDLLCLQLVMSREMAYVEDSGLYPGTSLSSQFRDRISNYINGLFQNCKTKVKNVLLLT
jgi:hypothetical protein